MNKRKAIVRLALTCDALHPDPLDEAPSKRNPLAWPIAQYTLPLNVLFITHLPTNEVPEESVALACPCEREERPNLSDFYTANRYPVILTTLQRFLVTSPVADESAAFCYSHPVGMLLYISAAENNASPMLLGVSSLAAPVGHERIWESARPTYMPCLLPRSACFRQLVRPSKRAWNTRQHAVTYQAKTDRVRHALHDRLDHHRMIGSRLIHS